MVTVPGSRILSTLAVAGTYVLAAAVSGCGTTVQPGEMGLKYYPLSEPALDSEVHPEGFYFQCPWNSIVTYNVTLKTVEETLEVLTVDDLRVPVRSTVTYRPAVDRLKRLHLEIGPEYYVKTIRPAFVSLLRTEFGNHKHNDLARHSPQIESKVLQQLRDLLKDVPVEISQIAITYIEFDRGLTKAISEKLIKQELLEQKRFEVEIAESDAEIARKKAKGEGDSIQIRAEGEARALLLRAKAQAEAQGEINKTLTPAYLQYKAFDSPAATRYYFVPTGKEGLPIIVNSGDEHPK